MHHVHTFNLPVHAQAQTHRTPHVDHVHVLKLPARAQTHIRTAAPAHTGIWPRFRSQGHGPAVPMRSAHLCCAGLGACTPYPWWHVPSSDAHPRPHPPPGSPSTRAHASKHALTHVSHPRSHTRTHAGTCAHTHRRSCRPDEEAFARLPDAPMEIVPHCCRSLESSLSSSPTRWLARGRCTRPWPSVRRVLL